MNKGKILVVDDEENIRGSLQGILSDEGYNVSLAEDGESALRMIRSDAPDLVLLDIWIPGIDGIQTLKLLKQMHADTEVVVMSGHGAIDTAVQATKLGAFDFIEKPFSLESILRTVAEALQARRSRAPRETAAASQDVSLESWFAGSSKQARSMREALKAAARPGDPLLICGGSFVSRKMAARLIHRQSTRRDQPFIEVSLCSIDEERFNAALFEGPEGSAFERAGGGVLFFNGVDILPGKLQRKLLKIFTDGAYKLPGTSGKIPVGARVIVSVERIKGKGSRTPSLTKSVAAFFAETSINLVPLHERRSDVPELAHRFVAELAAKYGKPVTSIDDKLVNALERSTVLGRIEELHNVLELAVLACEGPTLTGEHIYIAGQDMRPEDASSGAGAEAKKKKARPAARKSGSQQPQRTLRNSVVLCGQGLHSGLNTGLILSPLPPGSGVVFSVISTGGRVEARPEHVRSTEYATTLSNGDVTIKTVEHIMSALHSYHITNLLVKIGDEAPIMDGSAIEFCNIIEQAGIEEQDANVDSVVIDRRLSVGDARNGPHLAVEPAEEFSIHYSLDHPPPIGRQEHEYHYESGAYYKETIAPARTFGFLKDVKALEEMGLAIGGKLSNVILIDSEKVINTPLRFDNEPARHKVLDLIGDLYLLGRPIKGRFIGKKSGHTENIALVRKIQDHVNGRHTGARRHAPR